MKVSLKHQDVVAGIALYLQKQGFANVTADNLEVTFKQGRKDKNGLTAQVDIGAPSLDSPRQGTSSQAVAEAQAGAATLQDIARTELSPVEKATGELANTTVEAAPETPLTVGGAETPTPVAEQVAEVGAVDPVAPATPETEAAVAETPSADATAPVEAQPVEGTAPVAEQAPAEEAKPATEGKSLFG